MNIFWIKQHFNWINNNSSERWLLVVRIQHALDDHTRGQLYILDIVILYREDSKSGMNEIYGKRLSEILSVLSTFLIWIYTLHACGEGWWKLSWFEKKIIDKWNHQCEFYSSFKHHLSSNLDMLKHIISFKTIFIHQ